MIKPLFEELTQEKANELLDSGNGTGHTPLGRFIVQNASPKPWTAIFNEDGHAWCEDFSTKAEAIADLYGIQVDIENRCRMYSLLPGKSISRAVRSEILKAYKER